VNCDIFSCYLREVALVIIQHNDWRQAMRNKTKDGTTINTPMRKLIKKLPGELPVMLLNLETLKYLIKQENQSSS